MKKTLLFLFLFSLISCNDGDFDVPSFEFSETVSGCGEYVLYISNSSKKEVLALNLATTQLGTTVEEKSFSISKTASTSSIKATYRILDAAIGTNYFCQSIPPLTPKVTKELIAESGTVIIKTSEVITNSVVVGYKYEISMTDLLFFDGTERVFFETFNFGTITINI